MFNERYDLNKCLKIILEIEGGYVDNPHDPGGATKWGISLRLLKFLKRDFNLDGEVNKLDIIKMTKMQAKEIYKKYFWDKIKGDELQEFGSIPLVLFDAAVNCGAKRAVILLQKAINKTKDYAGYVLPDGILGSQTILAMRSVKPCKLANYFLWERVRYYNNLAKNPVRRIFLRGWINRILKLREYIEYIKG